MVRIGSHNFIFSYGVTKLCLWNYLTRAVALFVLLLLPRESIFHAVCLHSSNVLVKRRKSNNYPDIGMDSTWKTMLFVNSSWFIRPENILVQTQLLESSSNSSFETEINNLQSGAGFRPFVPYLTGVRAVECYHPFIHGRYPPIQSRNRGLLCHPEFMKSDFAASWLGMVVSLWSRAELGCSRNVFLWLRISATSWRNDEFTGVLQHHQAPCPRWTITSSTPIPISRGGTCGTSIRFSSVSPGINHGMRMASA